MDKISYSVKKIEIGLFWKFVERISVQGSQFLIQIILARLLSPNDYGALAIMMIFVNLATVLIQNGFNTALIQHKETDEEEFSSVFWFVLLMSLLLYALLYYSAPVVSTFYNMPSLEKPFKIICLMLIPGSLNSIQLALIRRSMDFKKEFESSIVSILISGILGIFCAFYGLGLWALVIQSLLKTTIASITMCIVLGWRPSFVFKFKKIIPLISYGYKLVLASVLNTLSMNLTGLIIGAKYSASSLGHYSRGSQFPSALMGIVNSSVQGVLLPVLSTLQDDRQRAKYILRKSIVLSASIVFPLMALLAGISGPMVSIVLTDKWLECVPYIQIFCFTYALWPIHTSNLQAINAMGRSDIYFRLEVYKKIVSIGTLSIAVFYFDKPIAIAGIGIISDIICFFINSYPNKYLLDYYFKEQMRDVLPYFLLSFGVFLIEIYIIRNIDNYYLSILLAIISGATIYILISALFKLKAYNIIIKRLKNKK